MWCVIVNTALCEHWSKGECSKLCRCSVFGNLRVALGIVNLVRDLEQDVDVPTGEKHYDGSFVCCGNTNVYCTVLYIVGIVLGDSGIVQQAHSQCISVEIETVQILVPEVLPYRMRTVISELVLAET